MNVYIKDSNNSWYDITKWIAYQGISFSRNDVEAPDSGRTLDGIMHRGRIAVKEKITIKTVPMSKTDVSTLCALLYPETIQVKVNPYPGTNASKEFDMYSNNVKTGYVIHRTNDDIQNLEFPLIEV